MTHKVHRHPVRPRVFNFGETAAYIGVSMTKFSEMRKSGEFSVKPLPYGDYFDKNAIDKWLDDASGLPTTTADHESAWIGAAHE